MEELAALKAQSWFPFMDLSFLDRLDQLKVAPVESSPRKRFRLQELDDKVGCGNHLHRLGESLHYSIALLCHKLYKGKTKNFQNFYIHSIDVKHGCIIPHHQ